ncbi:unnamed protein product [Sphagnum compactum]
MYYSDKDHGSSSSLFQALRMRELQPFKVKGRPSVRGLSSDGECAGSGVLTLDHTGSFPPAPPLAISYAKKRGELNLLAVADEEGYVSIFNTAIVWLAENCQWKVWMAHMNAIFDVSWMRDDTHMLTASGDQMIKLWNVEAGVSVGVMKGHSGSVKSLCVHPSHQDLFVSGSRDGSVAFWDVRSSDSSTTGGHEHAYRPVATIKDTHVPHRSKHVRRRKGGMHSVTAVLYQQDERVLATAGAVDGIVKFWDTRSLKCPVAQTPVPQSELHEGIKVGRVHGISGLSQDPTSSRIIASCTDSKIYMYNGAHPEKGVISSYSGHVVGSFYVKVAFSPDGGHILSGSSDEDAYIWQVDRPHDAPVVLKGHTGEVTAVDWCPTSFCKIATCSDDCTIRVWTMKEMQFVHQQESPIVCHRHRIAAHPISLDLSTSVRIYPENQQSTENLKAVKKVWDQPILAMREKPTGLEGFQRSPLMERKVNTLCPVHTSDSSKAMTSVGERPSKSSKRLRTLRDYFPIN